MCLNLICKSLAVLCIRLVKTSTSKEDLLSKLKNLRLYSFCKSHSYSYAQLVYKLAYQKAHNPTKFWKSTIKHVSSSYRKWVHLYEACRNGVDIHSHIHKSNCSVYAEHKKNKFNDLDNILLQYYRKQLFLKKKHREIMFIRGLRNVPFSTIVVLITFSAIGFFEHQKFIKNWVRKVNEHTL